MICVRCGCVISRYADKRVDHRKPDAEKIRSRSVLCAPCHRARPCRVCHGKGRTGSNWKNPGGVTCYRCGGHGRIPLIDLLPRSPRRRDARLCPVCNGRGFTGRPTLRRACYRCNGSGAAPQPRLGRPHERGDR